MKYRSTFDIASDILRAAREGNSTKTRLMYGAYLSFYQLNKYLQFLETNGLIKRDETTRVYSPTEKGVRLLHVLEDIEKLISLDEAKGLEAAKSTQ